MSKVSLHVYEVTKGLAAQLSSALLGRHIPGVWHTGVVCFGAEYCFGSGGIMQMHPGQTVIGAPDEVVDLGETHISHDVFEEYLFAVGADQFRPEKYHLFDHNCNNFSNEVAQFLTGKTVPSYILDLPRDVANTPLGAMLKTFMDGMGSPAVGGTQFSSTLSSRHSAAHAPSQSSNVLRENNRSLNSSEERTDKDESQNDIPVKYSYEIDECCLKFEQLFVDDQDKAAFVINSIKNTEPKDTSIGKGVECFYEMRHFLEEKNEKEFFISYIDILSIIILQTGLKVLQSKNGPDLLSWLLKTFIHCSFKADAQINFLKMATNLYSDKKHRGLLTDDKTVKISEINKGIIAECVECLVNDNSCEETTAAALSLAYNMTLMMMEEEAEIEISSALLHWIDSKDKQSPLSRNCIAALKNFMKANHQVKELAEMIIDVGKLEI